jgi:hypothetical protein
MSPQARFGLFGYRERASFAFAMAVHFSLGALAASGSAFALGAQTLHLLMGSSPLTHLIGGI